MQQNLLINGTAVDSSKSDTYSRGSSYNDEVNTLTTGYFYLDAEDTVKIQVTAVRMDSSGTGDVLIQDAVINIARISGAAAAAGNDGTNGTTGIKVGEENPNDSEVPGDFVGQMFIQYDGTVWTWNGTSWDQGTSLQGTSGTSGSSGTSGTSGSSGTSFSFGTIASNTLYRVVLADTSGNTLYRESADGELDYVTGTTAQELRVGGDVIAYYSSDKRLKENIQPIESASAKLSQLGGYTFDWNEASGKEGTELGVIAQEIEKEFPELVTTRKNGYKAVKYDKLVAVLIQSNKELLERIEALEEKVKNL